MISTAAYWSRLRGRVNTRLLARQFVIIVGVGWVGSLMALELGARVGVGHLGLIDGDRLEPENLPRHILPASYLWANKAEGTASYLSEVPGLDVGAINRHVDASLTDADLDRLLAPADAIVVATDSRTAQRRVAERANALDIPTVVPGLYAEGGGEIFVQLGPGHPCLLCWDDFRARDAEVRAANALSADSLAVVQEAVYLTVAVLDPASPEARELAAPDGDQRPRQLFIQRPGANLLRIPMNRRLGCAACGVGPSSVTAGHSRRSVRDEFMRHREPSAVDWAYGHSREHDSPVIESIEITESVVPAGSIVTVSWSTTNATHVELDGAGPFPTRGQTDVLLTESRALHLEAVNPFARASQSTSVRVVPIPQIGPAPLPPVPPTGSFGMAPTAGNLNLPLPGELSWPRVELPSSPFASIYPPDASPRSVPSAPRWPILPTPPLLLPGAPTFATGQDDRPGPSFDTSPPRRRSRRRQR